MTVPDATLREWASKKHVHALVSLEFQPDFVYTHVDHGRADATTGEPIDPDCPCRGTEQQGLCAVAGCGFC